MPCAVSYFERFVEFFVTFQNLNFLTDLKHEQIYDRLCVRVCFLSELKEEQILGSLCHADISLLSTEQSAPTPCFSCIRPCGTSPSPHRPVGLGLCGSYGPRLGRLPSAARQLRLLGLPGFYYEEGLRFGPTSVQPMAAATLCAPSFLPFLVDTALLAPAVVHSMAMGDKDERTLAGISPQALPD